MIWYKGSMLETRTWSWWQLLSDYQGLNQFREDGSCEHFNISRLSSEISCVNYSLETPSSNAQG